ncbi:MAG: L,D-transpeptidase [Verrucomicrobiaceae bacterium]|nr:L,D-transpeptidase [Verrucomicrobiaceae bacterium]
MIPRLFSLAVIGFLAVPLSSCVTDNQHIVEVSVPQQRLAVYRDGVRIREYPVSTSKFGLGDDKGSNQTPLGAFRIAKKIGRDAPAGAVFKSRKRTGEILPPDAPGRDPIVTRILWLKGTEAHNANAYRRYIYIHGTPEERSIGTPASYGCVRMKSSDIIDLFEVVGRGARVYIANLPLQGQAAPER